MAAMDVWRNNRAQLALKIHKLPAEIDAMPYRDYLDLIEVMEFNDVQKQRAAQTRRR